MKESEIETFDIQPTYFWPLDLLNFLDNLCYTCFFVFKMFVPWQLVWWKSEKSNEVLKFIFISITDFSAHNTLYFATLIVF